MALVAVDPLDARQFGSIQRTVGHAHVLGCHGVTAIGGHCPTLSLFVPVHTLNFGLKAGVFVQIELFPNSAAVRKDLRGVCVFFFGNKIQFFA